ncbi:uncharacterized protein LOC125946751 [Dermacentor silvarum]|uniref:uncharacterized protein LOC125946751 n=1 Tax=Dermacentor silvarum TaxID=543639 RepID=UPI0021015AAE|nr:uncharacterized protein LOC125946751 [Dermacentor silvarum]
MLTQYFFIVKPRRPEFYHTLAFLVMIILSSTILRISSCTIDCLSEDKPKAICLQGAPGQKCNCTCVPGSVSCPPLPSELRLCPGDDPPPCPYGWEFLLGISTCTCTCP